MRTANRITGLGDIRIYDKESGGLILEGQLDGMTYHEENGQGRIVKRVKPQLITCPRCGAVFEDKKPQEHRRLEECSRCGDKLEG